MLRQGDTSIRRVNAFNPMRQKLRACANILAEVQKLDGNVKHTIMLIHPKNFSTFNTACNNITAKNNQMGLTIGGYMKKLILLKTSSAIISEDGQLQNEAEKFRYLFDAHFTSQVSAVAGRKLRLKRSDRPEDLPEFADMSILASHCKEEMRKASGQNDTVRLSNVALAYLILYNKRRPFEVAELRRTTYIAEAYKSIKENHEILVYPTYAERVMATR